MTVDSPRGHVAEMPHQILVSEMEGQEHVEIWTHQPTGITFTRPPQSCCSRWLDIMILSGAILGLLACSQHPNGIVRGFSVGGMTILSYFFGAKLRMACPNRDS